MDNNYTHSFHPYPAKFPAKVIRSYIEKYSNPGECILDPFCGSGTTLVESRLLGRNSLGIDINPVGVLISKVKSECYTKEDIETLGLIIKSLENALTEPKKWINEHQNVDCLPDYQNRGHWFKDVVVTELSSIKSGIINQYAKSNSKIYLLLLAAFSKIIVLVSNQDTETRYARVEKDINVGDTLLLFLKTTKSYQKILGNNNILPITSKVDVIEGDTLKELTNIDSDSFDLVITSPPYINSFDYYLYHKHRIFLLNKSPQLVRKTEIGGHHTIDSQSYSVAYENYYTAMKKTFENLHRILKNNKKVVLLIGDGVVKGNTINMADLMQKIATETGFEIVERQTVPLKKVSKTFIKDRKIDKKKHHLMIFNNCKPQSL